MKKELRQMRIWMLTKETSARTIAEEYGCSEQFLGQFFRGNKPSKGLVDHLIDMGCPKEHFKNGRVVPIPEKEKAVA